MVTISMMPRVPWMGVLLPLALTAWSLGSAYARLRAMRYRATRQRLEITSGVFGQHTVTRELEASLGRLDADGGMRTPTRPSEATLARFEAMRAQRSAGRGTPAD